MKCTTSFLTLTAFAPLLVSALPTNTTLLPRDDPQCEIGFNAHPCAELNTKPDFKFRPQINKMPLQYTPHPKLPQSIGHVTRCFDFVDAHSTDKSKDAGVPPSYGPHGRTILQTDKRPLFTYPNNVGSMWMLNDGCKKSYAAVAVFERPGCQGNFYWYDLAKMHDETKKGVVRKEGDWCHKPFSMLPQTVGSMQMWGISPNNDQTFGTGVVIE